MLFAVLGCSAGRDETSREAVLDPVSAQEESAEDRALKKFAEAGPGTVTTVNCAGGVARIVDRSGEATVRCSGPNGSTTTTTISCEGGKTKSISRSDRITIYCPEQPAAAVAGTPENSGGK